MRARRGTWAKPRQLKPTYAAVDKQVTNGGAIMPAFKGTLSPQQIQDVAAYVSSVAGS
jgi:mono/diheme cytochrome c family protein